MGHEIQPEKCNILRISRRRPRDRFYTMCGEILQEVQEAKYLGVTISNNLKWEKHISAKTSRVNNTLHFISRTLRHCPENAWQLVYFTLVRSTLEYSCTVWDPHYGKDTDRLEMVNRRAARVVKGRSLRDREVSVTALLEDLKCKTLEERRKDLRLILMYKIVNGLVAVPTTPLKPASRRTRAWHSPPEYPSWVARCDIKGSVSTVLNPIFSKKVQGQKHPGRWGIVEHQIPSIKMLFKTNTKSHKHPSIGFLSKSKTQLVNQRKQKWHSAQEPHTPL